MNVGNLIKEILLAAHPVGSLYWSMEATDPGTLFGGTWERVKDHFILAAGDTYKAWGMGGAAEVTHRHGLNGTGFAEIISSGYELAYSYANNVSFKAMWAHSFDNSHPNTNAYTQAVNLFGDTNDANISTMPPYIVAYCWRRTA